MKFFTIPNKYILLLIFIGGLSFFLGTANPLAHIPLLSLLYPACLFLLAHHAEKEKSAFYYGFFTSLIGASLALYWITIPLHDYGYFPWILTIPAPLFFASYLGIFSGLFCLLIFKARAMNDVWKVCFAFLIWYFFEWFRSWFATGWTWLNFTSTLSAFPILIQGASIMGGQALGALFVGIACALVSKKRILQIGGFCLFICLILFGYSRMSTNLKADNISTVNYLLVQGNISQDTKWTSEIQEFTVNKYLQLTKQGIEYAEEEGKTVDIVVFPETALPFFLQSATRYHAMLLDFAKKENVSFLIGGVSYKSLKRTDIIYNSVFLLDKKSSMEDGFGIYSKQHLVPFGEYLPSYFNYGIFKALMQDFGGFTVQENQENIKHEDHNLGILICYEATFPEIAQESVNKGAEIFVNVSNDAWYGYSSAPRQHLDISILRAVEQDRYMVRATNTGITAFIDPHGRVLSQTELFEDATLFHTVSYRNTKTIYNKIEFFISYILNLIFFIFLYKLIRSRKNTV